MIYLSYFLHIFGWEINMVFNAGTFWQWMACFVQPFVANVSFFLLLIFIPVSILVSFCHIIHLTEPIAVAEATVDHTSTDPNMLSFSAADTVTVYSKEAGSDLRYWGGEVGKAYIKLDFEMSHPIFSLFYIFFTLQFVCLQTSVLI